MEFLDLELWADGQRVLNDLEDQVFSPLYD